MTSDEQIAKLEALLARVKSRARAEPGAPVPTNGVQHDAPATSAAPAAAPTKPSDRPAPKPQAPRPLRPLEIPTPMAAFRPSPIPPAPPVPSPPAPQEPAAHAAKAEPVPPPSAPRIPLRPEAPAFFLTPQKPPMANAPKPPLPEPEPSQVRRVNPPPMEVVELEVNPDPSVPPPSYMPMSERDIVSGEALESRSRLVSAPPASPAGEQDERDERDEDRDGPASDPTIEVEAAEVSRAELDALDAMIEESERAPTSSRRPISLEAKMSEPEDAPLHTPPPESGKLPAASPAIDVGFEASSPALPREAVRFAQARAQVEVAAFVGQAASRAPQTFGELLDATLSL